MWTPRDLIGWIRRLFAPAAETVTALEEYDWNRTGEVFARAVPETVRIVETYSYDQEISRNRNLQPDQGRPPAGRVEISLPYDGDHFFTRQAAADVEGQLPPGNTDPAEAVVGHLVFADQGRTQFDRAVKVNSRFTALPIRVPVSGGVLPMGYEHLIADRTSCVITNQYRPDPERPEILPVTVKIELLDPDSADFGQPTGSMNPARAQALANKVKGLGTFKPCLELRVTVQVHVAGGGPDLHPEVSLVSIGWPSVTSLSSFDLTVSGEQNPLIRYNPVTRSVEWQDVRMTLRRKKSEEKQAREGQDKEDETENDEAQADVEADEDVEDDEQDREVQDGNEPDAAGSDSTGSDSTGSDGTESDSTEREAAIRTYESPAMSLVLQHPGELYQESEVKARVDVRIPRLLSGMDARLYGATGALVADCEPELVSEVSTSIKVILDDAFAERTVSTSQSLHFSEVIPDPARVEDIKNALAGHGFERLYDEQLQAEPYRHLLIHQRRTGPDMMQLWHLVEGRRFKTERKKAVAGETFTTPVESGDLDIFAVGRLRTSSHEVTRAMNALQQVLRSPMAHVRVRR